MRTENLKILDTGLGDANGLRSYVAARAVIPAPGSITSRAGKGDYKENGFSVASIIVRKRD